MTGPDPAALVGADLYRATHPAAATRRTVWAGPDRPVLYPHTGRSHRDRCTLCWGDHPDAMWCADPCGPGVRVLCRRCEYALAAGRVPYVPAAEAAESWQWLARQHQNHSEGDPTGITDEVIDAALPILTPAWMPPQMGWARFEALQEALLEAQRAEVGDLDYGSLEPEWRDAEVYLIHCRGLVEDAVAALLGRSS